MVNQHYRWDFIGLSTDTKPTPETSEKVTDGSTFYTSDDSKLYVWYKDQWYEKEDTGGGGGGGGEGVKTLTEADYNYPANNPTSVALWLLPAGVYKVANPATDQVKISANIDNYGSGNPQSDLFIVIQGTSRDCSIIGYAGTGNGQGRCWTVTKANGYHTAIMNLNLATTTGTSSVQAMSQKAVTDALNALDARITALGG